MTLAPLPAQALREEGLHAGCASPPPLPVTDSPPPLRSPLSPFLSFHLRTATTYLRTMSRPSEDTWAKEVAKM